MNLSSVDQTLQFIAWFVALIELILALYVLVLNARHAANRHVSVFFLIFASTSFAHGLIIGATDLSQATWPTYLMAAVAPAALPGLLLLAGVLLKPQWLGGRWRRVWWLVYGLVFLPTLLTLVDIGLGTRLWYVGLDAETYAGGFVSLFEYAAGSLSLPLRVLNFYAISLVALVLLLYVALRDKEVTPSTRRLARLLLGVQIAALVTQIGLRRLLGSNMTTLITNSVFALTWAYAAFQQMISERRLQTGGRLQTRLTALVLVVTVPVLVAVVFLVSVSLQYRQVTWPTLAIGIAMLLALSWLTIRQALQPIAALTDMATAVAAGDLTRTAPVESEDEIGTLARAFNNMTEQLRGHILGLERHVAERTAELERRAVQLQAAADVASVATSVLDLGALLSQVVNLVHERFDLYYVGLFLLDETGRWAELRAGIGEAGRVMVEHGHRLEVGGSSMIGWCTGRGQARIALDVGAEAVRFENPLLPDTRSELALPLTARGRVIGALSVQDVRENAFSQEDVTVLQTVADQIAVAIDNARLFAAVEESLDEAQAVHRHYLREAWAGFATAHASAGGYRYSAGEVELDPDVWLPAMTEAQQQNQAVVTSESGGETALSLPITLRGEIVGMLGLKKDDESEWTDDDIALVQAVADQVALSLENVRLFDDAQRRAQHEALVRELTDKMRRTNEADAILETAVQELGRVLGSARAFVRLGVPPAEHLAQDDGAGE